MLKDPRIAALPVLVTCPVRFALVVTLPAVRPAAVPVQDVSTPAEGVPMFGVVSTGDVAKQSSPVPVSSVTAVIKLADEGVARNVATPAANPDTPDEIGRPVQLVSTPADGVPMFGVVSTGDVAKTSNPVPVSSLITPSS